MNLESVIAAQAAEVIVSKEGTKLLFVMPSTDVLPNDGILEYVTLESLYDFKSIPARSVVQVRMEEYDVLGAAVSLSSMLALDLKVLSGVPSADYDIGFDRETWAIERVSYAPLVSELALEMEIARQTVKNDASHHDKERAQFTRADGTVKKQTEFDVVTSDDEVLA